jgi:hypothetical protein
MPETTSPKEAIIVVVGTIDLVFVSGTTSNLFLPGLFYCPVSAAFLS